LFVNVGPIYLFRGFLSSTQYHSIPFTTFPSPTTTKLPDSSPLFVPPLKGLPPTVGWHLDLCIFPVLSLFRLPPHSVLRLPTLHGSQRSCTARCQFHAPSVPSDPLLNYVALFVGSSPALRRVFGYFFFFNSSPPKFRFYGSSPLILTNSCFPLALSPPTLHVRSQLYSPTPPFFFWKAPLP